ncbi:zonadhesin-like [Leptodactylus fuscus]|uniref:zonadhesin-like n=1 Tax=Leptodactylus fuscus TaxID=238119 RepID=UPI003F4E76B5
MARTSVILLSALSILFVLIPLQSADDSTICPKGKISKCGYRCQQTCQYLNYGKCEEKECTVGCYCDGETVEDAKGNCVKREECCKGGTEYKQCGSACKPTCATHKNNTPCTKQCRPSCSCPNDYVFRDDNNECVHTKDCP